MCQTLDTVTISADAKHRLRGEMAKLVQQLLNEQKKAASASKDQASQAALDAVKEVLCSPSTGMLTHLRLMHWCSTVGSARHQDIACHPAQLLFVIAMVYMSECQTPAAGQIKHKRVPHQELIL